VRREPLAPGGAALAVQMSSFAGSSGVCCSQVAKALEVEQAQSARFGLEGKSFERTSSWPWAAIGVTRLTGRGAEWGLLVRLSPAKR